MHYVPLWAALTGMLLLAGLVWFAGASVREHQPRAAGLALALALGVVVLSTIHIYVWAIPDAVLLSGTAGVWILGLFYFLPLGKPTAMALGTATERVDERDTMFAREEYEPDTSRYREYYQRHPDFKQDDDRLRRLPELLTPGGRYYDPARAERIQAVFRATRALTTQVDGEVAGRRTAASAAALTAAFKDQVLRLGAAEVGVARLDPMFVYSHVGRGPEPYGQPIDLKHRFAIAFTLEMDYECVRHAPDLLITEESATQYLRGANIAVSVARQIRALGYPARAHTSESNYQIMLPPVAQAAGLGELSRMGYLISRRYGGRVRLGAVTTDLPLVPDEPIAFGVQDFCAICLKCAENCPSSAIPTGAKTTVRGVDKWQLDVVRCLHYWRVAGTDCGLCMRACPYSHPPTTSHRLVRRALRRSAAARPLSVWAENFFYGRRVSVRRPQRHRAEA
jgi:ferredoxin